MVQDSQPQLNTTTRYLAQGLEDVTGLVSAPNVANLNISVSFCLLVLQAKPKLQYMSKEVSCLQFNKLVSLSGLETVMK